MENEDREKTLREILIESLSRRKRLEKTEGLWAMLLRKLVKSSPEGWYNIQPDDLDFFNKPAEPISGHEPESLWLVRDKGGKKYTLKLLDAAEELYIGSRVTHNLLRIREVVSNPPFLAPQIIPTYSMEYPGWFLRDYSEGESVDQLIKRGELPAEQSWTGRVLLTYAKMLNTIHEEGYLFVDNNWGAVIVNGDEVRICDYDIIASKNDMDGLQRILEGKVEGVKLIQFGGIPEVVLTRDVEDKARDAIIEWCGGLNERMIAYKGFFTPRYASREQLSKEPLTATGDVESFALMTDHLLTGDSFLPREVRPYDAEFEGYAKWVVNNEREYPQDRRKKLPPNIQEIVVQLLDGRRNDSLSAKDMVAAIEQDFGKVI